MLGPQVAMAADHATLRHPLFDVARAALQQALATVHGLLDLHRRGAAAWRGAGRSLAGQGLCVLRQGGLHALQPGPRGQAGLGRRGPEAAEYAGQPVHRLGAQGLAPDQVVQHAVFGQAAHEHQPVFSALVCGGMGWVALEMPAPAQFAGTHQAQVHAGRQGLIQPQLLPTGGFAQGSGGEVQPARAHRLLQLQRMVTKQEDPGVVRLDGAYLLPLQPKGPGSLGGAKKVQQHPVIRPRSGWCGAAAAQHYSTSRPA